MAPPRWRKSLRRGIRCACCDGRASSAWHRRGSAGRRGRGGGGARGAVRVLRRPGKLGLASAVLDGLKVARGDCIAVIDADLSHPPEALLAMVRAVEQGGVDLAVGSRYIPGGGMEDWPWTRQVVSMVA